MNAEQKVEALRLAQLLHDNNYDDGATCTVASDTRSAAAALLRTLAAEPAIEQALAEAHEAGVLEGAAIRGFLDTPNYAKELGECTGAIQTLEREVAYWKSKAEPQGEPAPDAQQFVGTIPAEESDDEFARAIEAMDAQGKPAPDAQPVK